MQERQRSIENSKRNGQNSKTSSSESDDSRNSNRSSSKSSSRYQSSKQQLQKDALETYIKNNKTIQILKKNNIKYLFPVQYATYDYIYDGNQQLLGYDLIGKDRTGSGKTIAYSLPILQKLRENNKFYQPLLSFLIICPTRQLVIQVTEQIEKLKHSPKDFKIASVYGGKNVSDQIRQLREGVNIVVATPGRLIDMIDKQVLQLSRLRVVCIDEADEMLKMGFQEDIQKIFVAIKKKNNNKVQNLLFSATIPDWVHQIARKYLSKNKKFVDMIKDHQIKTSKTINHLIINCPYYSRNSAIADVVNCYGGSHGRTIIFCQTKKQANQIFMQANIKQETQVLHGDIPQKQREGKLKCLVSTNVAARGLDIPQVDLIIQLQPPKDVQTYIHRSGRTGRAGRPGQCVTFFTKQQQYLIDKIQRVAKIKFKKIGAPQPQDIIKSSARDIALSLKNVSENVIPFFSDIADELIKEQGANISLSKALALISGYTEKLQQRSLLCSIQGYITYILRVPHQFHSNGYIYSFFRNQLSNEIADQIKGLRKGVDKKSAYFDIPDKFKQEMNNLKQKLQNNYRNRGYFIQVAKSIQGVDDDSNQNKDSWNEFKGDKFQRKQKYPSRRKLEVFIGGLPYKANEKQVIQYFSRNGCQFVNIRFLKDQNGASKGIAFGECSNQHNLSVAINLNGSRFGYRTLKINHASQK